MSTAVRVPVAVSAPATSPVDSCTTEPTASEMDASTCARLTPSRSATKLSVCSRPSPAEVPNAPISLAICWETAVSARTSRATNTVTDSPAAG